MFKGEAAVGQTEERTMLSCRWILVMALLILNSSVVAALAGAQAQRPVAERSGRAGQGVEARSGRDQLSIRSIPACRRS